MIGLDACLLNDPRCQLDLALVWKVSVAAGRRPISPTSSMILRTTFPMLPTRHADTHLTSLSRILSHESTLIPGSTIGKHLRHSLDHYRLLLDAVPSTSAAAGVIEVNYDTRVRMVDMETSPNAALNAFEEMDKQLAQCVDQTDLDQDIRLTALTPYHQEFGTTFGREVRINSFY